jgi:hypothetical protein
MGVQWDRTERFFARKEQPPLGQDLAKTGDRRTYYYRSKFSSWPVEQSRKTGKPLSVETKTEIEEGGVESGASDREGRTEDVRVGGPVAAAHPENAFSR